MPPEKFLYNWPLWKFDLIVEDKNQILQLKIVIARRISSIIIYTNDWKQLNSDNIYMKASQN